MKNKVFTSIALIFLLAALTVVLAACSTSGAEPKSTNAPESTEATPVTTDETATNPEGKTPAPEVDEAVTAVLDDLYSLKAGDFSKLEKYWYGDFAARITGDGKRMESAVTVYKAHHRAVPIVMTDERWDGMWAKANEEYKDDPEFEFIRTKLEGMYALKDPEAVRNVAEATANMTRWVAAYFSIDLTKSGAIYVCDTNITDPRMDELEGYFKRYFGYTLDDVRDAAREAGMPRADLIGTEEPYFVFEYPEDGMKAIPMPYSEVTVEKLESLCKEAPDLVGAPIRYYKCEYEIKDVRYVSEGEKFDSVRDEYIAETGGDLLGIWQVILNEKAVGETLASTGEYREYGPDEQVKTERCVYMLLTDKGVAPGEIDFPWDLRINLFPSNYYRAFPDEED